MSRMARSGRRGGERGQRGGAIGEGADMIALLLQQHADGGQDVLVVVDKGDIGHGPLNPFGKNVVGLI